MKVYLDDERDTPPGWCRVYTVKACVELLETRTITHLSLDNDLGTEQPEGFRVLDYLEAMVHDDPSFPMPEVSIHSANSTRRAHMKRALESIERIRQQQAGEEK